MSAGIERVLDEKRVVVCLGPGGAGKTTISAVIALQGVVMGKNTLALTIDPSWRLATSMGMDAHGGGNNVTTLKSERLEAAGIAPNGTLDVMLLDVKSTFDDLIARLAPSPGARDDILQNDYYRTIADSLSGSHEYMAIEALLAAYEEGGYDLIVVDTPPSRHFLDFLSAPKRLIELLDAPGLRLLARSERLAGSLSFGITKLWSNLALRAIERVVGVNVLRDVWNFFMDIECINDPLKERAERAFGVLQSDESVFFLVTRPDEPSLEDAVLLLTGLSGDGYDVGGVVVNRLLMEGAGKGGELSAALGVDEPSVAPDLVSPPMARKIGQCRAEYRQKCASEKEAVRKLSADIGREGLVLPLPELDREVCDIEGLSIMREILFSA